MATTIPKTLDSKTTIYLNGRAKKAARMYAVHHGVSLSQILNERLEEYLEDQADITAIDEVMNDPDNDWVPFEEVVKELGIKLENVQSNTVKTR